MRLPRIAIVGRPNVGKSSLINMLAARKVSIVDPTAGTTRDRVSSIIGMEGEDPTAPALQAEFTDTGGYGVYTVEGRQIDDAGHDLAALTKDIERQISEAVRAADIVLLVIDAQAGLTPQDEEVARLLREGGLAALDEDPVARRAVSKAGKGSPSPKSAKAQPGKKTPATSGAGAAIPTGRVLVVANKVDGPRWEMHALEGSALGFGEPLPVSARNNYRRREFTEALYEAVKRWNSEQKKAARAAKKAGAQGGTGAGWSAEADAPPPIAEMHLAMVGKRNAGKSTLVNTLAGQPRVIVSEIPGTTRDAIDVRFDFDGKTLVAIDTAGLRKKKSFQDRIEWYALDRLQLAVQRCDVALMLIDATEPVSQVDQHVAQMITESYKPVIIVVNKWDLARGQTAAIGAARKAGQKVTTGMYEEYLRKALKGLWYAPIAFISAKEGSNVRETIDLAFEMMNQTRTRVGTGVLNRLMHTIVERQGPTSKLGTFAKVLFASQVDTAPPTILCVVNKPELFTPNYQRFLLNRFREELPFTEVPIKLIIRARKQDDRFEEEGEGDGGRARGRSERERPSAKPARTRTGPGRMKSGAEFFDE